MTLDAMKPSKDEQIATLTRDLAAAREQLAAANATVEKCKAAGFVTADGVIALPGTFVYAKWWNGSVAKGFVRHETHGSESCCFVEMTTTTDDGRTIGVRTFLSDCYSTRTAAEAAREGKETT
jgi:hypothetical protein